MLNFSILECFADRNEPGYFVLGGKQKSAVSSLNLCTNVRGCISNQPGQLLLYNTCAMIILSSHQVALFNVFWFVCFQTITREYLTLPSLRSQEKNEPKSSQAHQTSTLLVLQNSSKKSSMVSADEINNPWRYSPGRCSVTGNIISSFTCSVKRCPRRACTWTKVRMYGSRMIGVGIKPSVMIHL